MIKTLLNTFCCLAEKSNHHSFPLKSVLLTLLVLTAFGSHAQVSSYAVSSTYGVETFTNLTGGSPLFPATTWNDNISPPIPLGMNFNFNGKVYTQCYVSSNGFITFGNLPSQIPLANNYNPLSDSQAYDGAISAFGCNFRNSGVQLRYKTTTGSPGNEIFTFEFIGKRGTTTPTAGTYRSQIILHELTGQIEIRYKVISVDINATVTIPVQIGLRGETNHDFNNRSFTASGNWNAIDMVRGTSNTDFVNTNTSIPSIDQVHNIVYNPPTCFAPRQVLAMPLSITNNSATLSWTASTPAPASGYQYMLIAGPAPTNINAGFPLAGTTSPIMGTTAAGVTTALVTGLATSTPYQIYVRANCGSYGGWSAAGSFATLCDPLVITPTITYLENFESITPPALPPCVKLETLAGAPWYSAVGPFYGFNDKHMRNTSVTANNNAYFFTKGLVLQGGKSYRLSYKYGSSQEFTFTSQGLRIQYGTAPVAAAMIPANTLADYPTLKAGPFVAFINFTPSTSGTYYIGFYDYSSVPAATTLIDDIEVRESVCFDPVLNPATGITSGSATVTWTPPTTPPTGGYEYYYSSDGSIPGAATTPTGNLGAGVTTLSLAGLTPSRTYCVWVRSNCGGGDISAWSANICFNTLPGATLPTCLPSGAGYAQDQLGITNVTFSNVNNTTGIEPSNYGDYSYLTGYASQGSLLPVDITYRTNYTYNTIIWVDWDKNGTFDPLPYPTGERMYIGTSPQAAPALLNASVTIPGTVAQGAYRMRIGGIDDPIYTGGPLTPCRVGAYQAFEDYTLWVTGPSPAITLTTAPSTTVCRGSSVNVTITSPVANYDTYTWEPATGVTGTAPNFVLTPMTSTTYVLSGFNSVDFTRTSTAPVAITVKNAPTPVTITPATFAICQNTVAPLAPLTVTGGTISGVAIYSEDFNGTAPGWVQSNFSSAPDPVDAALASWALYPDGANIFFTTYHSNDNSQFALSDSDAPGGGSITNTTLTSPSIDLNGYTAASLSFYQFYRNFLTDTPDESATIEVSTTNGTTWVTPALFFHDGTTPIGTATNFALATFDLTPYINNIIKIRFTYKASYDFSWAIDNFAVTGSATSNITWAPTTGLYTTAAGTIPYTGGATATVYPKPSTTTSYTATATFGSCPVVSAPVTVTVAPINGGTITTPNQTVCSSANAVAIVSTGTAGSFVWQWATDAAFTTPNTITGSNNLTTLTTALIGAFSATRYYRIYVTATGCSPAVSSPVHSISFVTTTWDTMYAPFPGWSNGAPDSSKQAVFNTDYTVNIVNTPTSVISACSLTINAGVTVTVNSGFTVAVTNGVTVSSPTGRFIFEDDSSLLQVSNAVNTGAITYKRITTPIRKFDYTYWSSPVNAQQLLPISPNTQIDKFYWFNTTTYQWTSVTAPGITAMTPGRGYIIRGPNVAPYDTAATVFPTYFGYSGTGATGGGIPNNGDIDVTVGWNSAINNLDCIGNPYPSAISADALMTHFQNTVAGSGPLPTGGTTFYFWTHNTPIGTPTALNYTDDDYALYNLSGGAGTRAAIGAPCAGCNNNIPNGYIAAGQGFMVITAPSAANPLTNKLHFTNAMRRAGNNAQFFRQANDATTTNVLEKSRVWLDLSNTDGAYKQMMVGYIENATDGIDSGFDGKVVEAGNRVSLYSIAENTKLTIQGKALPFNSNDEIPLGYRTTTPGVFQINMSNFDGAFEETPVYLEDLLLGTIHNLKQSAYSFTTEVGTFDTRFVLRYTNNMLGTNTNIFNSNEVVVYKNNRSVFIETTNTNMKSVQIYDLRGRLIAEQIGINSTKAEFNNLNAAQQVLLVQITSNDNVTVTKKIIF